MNLKELIGLEPPKNIDQLIRDSIKLDAPFQHFATVMVQKPDGIIKGIGQSGRNNLILDNFGTFLAGHFLAPVQANLSITLKPEGGVNDGYWLIKNASDDFEMLCPSNNATGSVIKLGSGSTASARTDYDIETDLLVAPEDDFFNTGSGAYGAGSVGVSGTLVTGGAGTINEIGMFGVWQNDGAGVDNVMLFHDILAVGEAYVLGETVTATYTIAL